MAEKLEKPLPKPQRDPVGYAAARVLEALLESLLALRFLKEGYTRNAAGKAYQAWRALTGALLVICQDKIKERLCVKNQEKWLVEKAMPRIPSTRLKPLSQLLEETCIPYYSSLTDKALGLHDYQYHGPDPDLELSKYTSRSEAAYDIRVLVAELAKIVEKYAKPALQRSSKWTRDHEETLAKLKETIGTGH